MTLYHLQTYIIILISLYFKLIFGIVLLSEVEKETDRQYEKLKPTEVLK